MKGSILNYNKVLQVVLGSVLFLVISGCEKVFDLKKPPADPVAVFDEAWGIIDQRYAMFSIKGVDWKNNYQIYRPQVTRGMTDQALFRIIATMLETLQDGHVALISGTDKASYDNFYKAFPVNFNFTNIRTNYLKNDYKTSGPVIYKTVDNIGYFYYNSFYNDISDEQLDRLFNDISQTKGLIVDIRSNPGGNSRNADKIFSRFIQDKRLVKYEVSKKGAAHDELSEPSPIYLFPEGQTYTRPVVVLSNRSCFSACNDFVMYMSGKQDVKLIGDQTGGGGGIPQDYLLANGWRLQYTATLTLSPDKNPIENGIQPDINIGISSFDELSGKDPILEKAFQLLK